MGCCVAEPISTVFATLADRDVGVFLLGSRLKKCLNTSWMDYCETMC